MLFVCRLVLLFLLKYNVIFKKPFKNNIIQNYALKIKALQTHTHTHTHTKKKEKAEEPEIKLPTSAGSWKKRVPEKHLFLLY